MKPGLIKQVRQKLKKGTPMSDKGNLLNQYISYVYNLKNFKDKMKANNIFRKKTKFTQDEIKSCRNKHPAYALKKKGNHNEMQNKRNKSLNKGKRIKWTQNKKNEFIELTHLSEKELALHFDCTIPAIQAMRREIKKELQNVKKEK